METNRPIYLRGKVILDHGGQLSEPVPIQRVCGSTAHREGYTDSHGNFSILVGDNTNFQDASESGSFGNRPANISSRQLWNCEIRAVLPGYSSSSISLAGRDFNDMAAIGNIVLSKAGGGEGNSISVTSLKAPDKAKNEYQKALDSYEQKKYADADKHLAKALTVYPQYASAWELRGRAQQRQQQDAEAVKSYQAAIAADEKFVSPYIRLAALISVKSDWAEVLRLTDRALQLDPLNYPDAWFLNGAAHYNLKQYPEAERAAAKAVTLDKEHRFPRAELLMASLFQMKGNNAAAAEHFRIFVKLEPQSPETQRVNDFLAKYDQQTASAKPAPTVQAEPQKQ
jgi:tetratricopeptide (TPR) repeat protein